MKRIICLTLALTLALAALSARADLLTEWGIPQEIAARADVQKPHAADGEITWTRELAVETEGAQPAGGWLAEIEEVYYDGVTAFVAYAIRGVGVEETLGTLDRESGRILLDAEDEHFVSHRGVGWHEDSILLNGRKVSMPLTDEAVYGSTELGVVKHYLQIRLDQADLALTEDDSGAAALPLLTGGAQTLGLPIGDEGHLNGRALTMEEQALYSLAANRPPEMGYITVALNALDVQKDIKTRTFTVNRTIGDSTIGEVETIITPVRMYVNVTLEADAQKTAEQHEKDKQDAGWAELPEAFSAGVVNEAWAFSAVLVDGDGRRMDSMGGMFTGMMGVGADEAMYVFNLPLSESEQAYPGQVEFPEKLFLAPVNEDGQADMTKAVQVY